MSKVSCYVRSLRKRWNLTQEEVAALLPKGDRNRVSHVENGKAMPNADEILAYAVIFGACGKEVFPDFYGRIEEAVMRSAYELSEKLKRSKKRGVSKKLDLITQMFARATGQAPATGA